MDEYKKSPTSPAIGPLEHAGTQVRMARRTSFSSAHLYSQPAFSEAQNRETFGRCFTPHGHGHNYVLEAFFDGPIQDAHGMLVNLIDIDQVLKAVVDPLDHQHLNFDIAYFKDKIPTTEIIAQYCFRELLARLNASFANVPISLCKVRLYELDDLFVEYSE
ncbi:MAG: 6-carboxytetrahydropterin synthase [Bdellovibrionaceae bacterium]|nr:6-carboxytetrahydropterin synthase [Pseudobdellovibrionaceae bacterium]